MVIAALAWVILEQIDNDPPPLEITDSPEGISDPPLRKPTLTGSLQRKPSAPGAPSMPVLSAVNMSPMSVQSIEAVSDAFGSSAGNDFGGGLIGGGPGGPVATGIHGLLRGRCNQADRMKRLRDNGGTPALDRKVVSALDWLKTQQNEDGSWGAAYPVAMTGFAILAYSVHCETVDSPRYGTTLIKAIDYLLESARANNGLIVTRPGQHSPYEHGIATYALAEAYALNKNSKAKVGRIQPVVRDAVPIIIEGQTNGGGWLYGYGQSGTGDLSISGWNIQALKAAQLTGQKFSGLGRAMKKALAYIESASAPRGLFRYRVRDDDNGRLSLTGVGVLCARMLGRAMASEDESFAAILGQKPQAFRAADLYALYYHSQACFQKGGDTWSKYNGSYQKLVIDSQEHDGSWPVASGHLGAAQPDAKIYHTCLCTLMLEVYYRYLPATSPKA